MAEIKRLQLLKKLLDKMANKNKKSNTRERMMLVFTKLVEERINKLVEVMIIPYHVGILPKSYELAIAQVNSN